MIPYLWEISKKNLKKIFHRSFPCDSPSYGKFPFFFTNPLWKILHKKNFPYGKSPTFSIWEIPTCLYGEFPLLFLLLPYGKSPYVLLPPLWEIPKKNLEKKIFLRDIWTTVPPKMGVPPGERGHGGIPTPPYGIYGGG